MNDENNNMLKDRISDYLSKLESFDDSIGSKECSAAYSDFEKLYRLLIDENKMRNESFLKDKEIDLKKSELDAVISKQILLWNFLVSENDIS